MTRFIVHQPPPMMGLMLPSLCYELDSVRAKIVQEVLLTK